MEEPFVNFDADKEVKITVIGGGTGSFTMLSALKKYTKQIAAVVNMADDGGSTGALRDELGTLPPGDVRQCLVALSDSPKIRDLFDYRFDEGTLQGHSFGNILLTALEKVTGSFSEAIATASEILRIDGIVIPATLDNIRLKMEWEESSLILKGERLIDADHFKYDPRKAKLSLVPEPEPNPLAIKAINDADIVVVSPGDLYTSLGPLLIIPGIGKALKNSKAMKIYVSNLVTKDGQTTGFTVSDHASEIERFAGIDFIDYVLYNNSKPTAEVAQKYEQEKGYTTEVDEEMLSRAHYKSIGGNFIGELAQRDSADSLPVTRSLIRHDAKTVAEAIIRIYEDDRNN